MHEVFSIECFLASQETMHRMMDGFAYPGKEGPWLIFVFLPSSSWVFPCSLQTHSNLDHIDPSRSRFWELDI